MSENNQELLQYIYKTAEMGKYSTTELMKELHGKDNKIKEELNNILKEYEKFYEKSLKLFDKFKIEEKETGFMAKMSVSISMKKEVLDDNSDASMADMLIKGLTMGSLEMSKKIDQYEKKVDNKILDLAKELHKFQEKQIDNMKKYL
ncbi:MAG: hypothetical protein HFH08_01050 [Bacilli bacterium]|nr:hypothetical protein [Bacilli bacterium]